MYKQATQLKIRFSTPVGSLSIEQLWDIKLSDLKTSILTVNLKLKGQVKESNLDFLEENQSIDPIDQLKFDILKDVYLTRKEEARKMKEIADKKANNQRILGLIAQKKDESLANKSIEELEKLLQ